MSDRQPPVAVLAIDGGNSKMDVALLADDGRVLGYANGPGANAQTVGLPAAVQTIRHLVTRAAASAGLTPRDGEPLARHTAAYLAGVDIPQEHKAMDDALREFGWSLTTTVDNDTFAIFRAGTTSHWGVGIVCGAGINAVGLGPDGRVVRFPAIGTISGDFGGGGDLSRFVIWHAVRDEDGRGEPTMLRRAVTDHFGLPTVNDVVIALHVGDITQRQFYDLPRLLFRVAAAGDPVAVSLIDRQAQEIALLARATTRRLDLFETPTDVVLGGGVVTARDPLLMERIDTWMAKEAPQAVVRINDVPAIAGAALLGFDHLGIDGEAEQTLRAALRVA
ncbi:MAG TPA: BadF/BadG/BcrA/BcrD ATPase family protein [Acidothermaceae bacterium]|nr:BadF/BadG/BcrA/BcrD ATPase family protein [Acidothermaceae bacterium]